MTAKSHQDPDQHGLAPWIRIRFKTNADPQHCLFDNFCFCFYFFIFILQGADVNQEIDGRLPLHYASDYGQLEVLKYLCSKVPNYRTFERIPDFNIRYRFMDLLQFVPIGTIFVVPMFQRFVILIGLVSIRVGIRIRIYLALLDPDPDPGARGKLT